MPRRGKLNIDGYKVSTSPEPASHLQVVLEVLLQGVRVVGREGVGVVAGVIGAVGPVRVVGVAWGREGYLVKIIYLLLSLCI